MANIARFVAYIHFLTARLLLKGILTCLNSAHTWNYLHAQVRLGYWLHKRKEVAQSDRFFAF